MTSTLSEPLTSPPLPTRVRYWVLAWLCAAALIAYVHRAALSVAEKQVARDLALTVDDMGWVFSAFFLGYALFQIPSGWLADRWGSRVPLALCAAAWSLGTVLLALSVNWWMLLAVWFGCGVAQAGVMPCAARSITHWWPSTRRSFTSGMLGASMSVGAAASAWLVAALIGQGLGWSQAILCIAFPGFAWAVGFAAWYRERPGQHPGVNVAELALIEAGMPRREPGGPIQTTPWRAILSTPSLWFVCGQQSFRAAGYVFFVSWFPTFLKDTRGLSELDAGKLTSLPLLAVVVGSALAGAVSDWLLAVTGSRRISRQGLAVAALLACAALVLPAWWIQDAHAAVYWITAGSFCAALGGPVSYSVTMDLGGRHVGTVFGMMNMSGNLGAAAFPAIAAQLHTATGDWQAAFFAFAGTYVLAAICWMLVDPNRTIGDG